MKKFFIYCACLLAFLKFIETGMEVGHDQSQKTMNEYGLVEMSIGNDKAQKTMTVYYSLACFFSRRFLSEVYPEMKRKYVDTGKLRLVFREFYLPPGTEWTVKLSRINGPKEYFAFVDYALNNKVVENSNKPNVSIVDLVMPFFSGIGYSKSDVEKAMNDTQMMPKVHDCANKDGAKYHIQGAPSFVSGEQVHVGLISIEAVDKFMETGKLE